MKTVAKFETGHEDLVHDICYDYYGKRLATCSSDQRVKIWDLVENKETNETEWKLNDSWKAHDAAVLRVAWAHPEFGQVIATCSFDRTIRIWEEQEHEPKQSEKRWMEKARLVDSRGTVQDIEFAPNFMGLKLATVSVDGMLRIYEAMDIVNLAHWTLMEDFEVLSSTAGGTIREKDTEFCLSWCKSRFLPASIAVGCGRQNTAKIFKYDDSTRKWIIAAVLNGHGDSIHDISWAPSVGRSYQLIGTGCKDKKVRIFKVYSSDSNGGGEYSAEMVAELGEHEDEVWRVEWNLTGTILASSGDDGRVILWKCNYLGEWASIGVYGKQLSQQQPGGAAKLPFR